MKRTCLSLTCCLILLAGWGVAPAAESWIHVHVDSESDRDESVRVSIPFSLVEAVLPAIDFERFDHGRLRIEDGAARFYTGRLAGRVELDATAEPPRLSFVQGAADVQVGPLVHDLTGKDRVTGRGSVDADLTAAGQTLDALKRDLGGRGAIRLVDGSVRGFNLEHMIRQAGARLKGQPAPSGDPQRMDFSELSASAEIRQGVLTNRDLVATSRYVHVTGEGRVDLADKRFDYRFAPVFVKPPEGRGIKEIEDIPLPVHLTGSFDDPKWDVELGPVLQGLARERLERELDKGDALRKLEERTGIKGLEKGLRGLFGR